MRGFLLLMITLFICVLAGGCVLPGAPPGQNVTPEETSTPAVLSTETPQECCDYCYIQEVQPDSIDGAVIVPLSAEDLKDFPQFGEIIMHPRNDAGEWYNGERTAGDFNDCQHQYEAFLNLSCKVMSYQDCQNRTYPVVFTYGGRYFEPSCLPSFGCAHRNRPGG